MFTARKASVEDCGLIREMACVAFPDTYKTILSPEQLDYMMEWMYSPKTSGGRWPKGTYITSPTRTALPAAISLSARSGGPLHPAKIYILPRFQGVHAGSFLFRKAIEHIKQLHPAPAGWSST